MNAFSSGRRGEGERPLTSDGGDSGGWETEGKTLGTLSPTVLGVGQVDFRTNYNRLLHQQVSTLLSGLWFVLVLER